MSNKQYTPITIEGEQYIQAVNPFKKHSDVFNFTNPEWLLFNQNNPPILWKGTPLSEGAVLDESEIERGWAYKNESSIWKYMPAHDEQSLKRYVQSRLEVRQVATLKVKPTTGIHRQVGIVDFGKPKANQEGEQGREEIPIDPKKIWGKWYNVVKNNLDKNGYVAGDKISRSSLGFEQYQVEYLHQFSTRWRPVSIPKEQPVEQLPIGHAEIFLKECYKKQFVNDLPAIGGHSLPQLLETYLKELKQQGYSLIKN